MKRKELKEPRPWSPIVCLALAQLFVSSTPVGAALSAADRDEIKEISKAPPSVELELDFENRSDKIGLRSKAFHALESLGNALTYPELRSCDFVIAGHTGDEGIEAYNLVLSERRAAAVKRFLVENFDIEPDRLIDVAYGSSKLKDPADPSSLLNQRVQVLNVENCGRRP